MVGYGTVEGKISTCPMLGIRHQCVCVCVPCQTRDGRGITGTDQTDVLFAGSVPALSPCHTVSHCDILIYCDLHEVLILFAKGQQDPWWVGGNGTRTNSSRCCPFKAHRQLGCHIRHRRLNITPEN